MSFTTTQTTPSVQFLIDRSLSMGYTLDTTSGTSRYTAVSNAVQQVVGQLQAHAYFGASLFTQTSTLCPRLDNTPARRLNNLSQIQQLIGNFSPTGFTPTAEAFAQTAGLFASNPPPTKSPAIIVLATDGEPNTCDYNGDPDAKTVAAISDAYDNGIRTFILGIAGVNDIFLQQAANAGQGAVNHDVQYFTADTPQQLDNALQTIIGRVTSCELSISGVVDPSQASSGTVTLDGMTLTYGLQWDLVDNTTLRLLGSACQTLQNAPSSHVDATFPCQAVIF